MSLDHSANGIPAITREEHGHQGNDPDFPGYQRVEDTLYQSKVIESGGYTYVCRANVGKAVDSALWQIFRADAIGNVMWADANTRFDNVATDPTALTYSYT